MPSRHGGRYPHYLPDLAKDTIQAKAGKFDERVEKAEGAPCREESNESTAVEMVLSHCDAAPGTGANQRSRGRRDKQAQLSRPGW